MAEKWVETTVREFTAWAPGQAGEADLHGARILLELADLNETGELTPELLREVLLEDFPDEVMASADDAPAILAIAGELVRFFEESEQLDSARAAELRETLGGIAEEFTAALAAEGENAEDAAEFLGRMMSAEGVDLEDEEAVAQWMREFDELSDEEKLERTMQHFAAENVVPPVRLLPADELAAAARASGLFTDVLGLADWVGARDLEEDELAEADAAAAVAALGIPAPRAGGAFQPELERLWGAAVETGLIDVQDGRTAPGGRPESDEDVLALFVGLLDAVVTQAHEEGDALSPGEVVQGELPGVLLHMYEHGGETGIGELVVGLIEHIQEGYDIVEADVMAQAVPVALRLELDDLARWGVLTVEEDTAALTPLGVFAVRELLQADGYTAPLIGDLAETTAEELVTGLAWHREDTAEEEISLWLARREPEEAATGLLNVMLEGRAAARNLAAVVLQSVPQEAEPVIRAALDAPQTRPYAVVWLSGHGDDKIEPSPADMQWMFVDTVAGMIEAVGPHEAVHLALDETEDAADLHGLIEDIWRIEHPDTADVLEAIGDHHHDKPLAKLARKTAFKVRSR
ncbi:hypothetical protein [Actinocorallia longicatena]|uniref:Uncharacterized protein n=1 Tax=Actinocorallia longicatena TaxID=111803 RepID=A0ABP6QEL9_9ACTN